MSIKFNNKKLLYTLGLAALCLSIAGIACAEQTRSPKTVSALASPTSAFLTGHSDFPGSIILGRPEDKSITASMTTNEPCMIYLEWGENSGVYTAKSKEAVASAQNPAVLVMDGLSPNKEYYYRVMYRTDTSTTYQSSDEYTFHTLRTTGSNYNFVIQSDSHLLNKADHKLYAQSMQTMAELKPDFILDLGDTFLNDQKADALTQSYESVVKTVTQQLPYFDLVTRSAPLFLTIGNHEGEYGAYLDGTADNLAAKSALARTTFFPNPVPDSFYSGDSQKDLVCGLPQDYYAFTWGDALYVSIDPYRYSSVDPNSDKDGWGWTLGKTQYDWFRKTLETSNAKYKFVFAHHAIGNMRGGEEIAKLYEWGGYDKKGQYLFDQKRPGWGKPIQQIMKDTGVTIFFQGHDHLFAREDVDGVVYQTLPKPAELVADKQSNFSAYPKADVLLNSGFLNITVTPENVRVDYSRNYFVSSDPQEGNTGIVYSYTVDSVHHVQVLKSAKDNLAAYGGNVESSTKQGQDKGVKQGKNSGNKSSKSGNGTLGSGITLGVGATPAAAMASVPTGGFSFAIQSDSHLDENTDENLYKQTLNNIAAAKPHFLIDLGDTSMVEKFAKTETEAAARYAKVKSFFSLLGTLPIYPVTGNHDGENGWDAGSGIQTWARADRQKYLPMPSIMPYTGNVTTANYYSFVKGEAQFIILDPFTYSLKKAQGDTDGWNYTLGRTQYDWLVSTLQNSKANYKFVFIHNLVGGEGKDARGGAETAQYFEWGGNNADGTYGFDQMRPGWGKPIHQLLVDYGVNVVFHGHDHFYARQEYDGITYQLVPQPGGKENTVNSAAEYGYKSGTILPPAGYLRVIITKQGVQLEYVKSITPGKNGKVVDCYDIGV